MISAPGTFLLVTPRSYWLQSESVISGEVTSIEIDLLQITEEVYAPREDDEVISTTWIHATKRGERDLRYRDNRQLWEVRRYLVELSFGDYRWCIKAYSLENACLLTNAFSVIAKKDPTFTSWDEDDDADNGEGDFDQDENEGADSDVCPIARTWYEVLDISSKASLIEIKAAYRKRQMEYHPDRVAHLGEKLRALAGEEAKAINQAYSEAIRVRR